VPLPSNMEFIMQGDSLATVTQMFMVENTDLIRELTIFMQMHMNSHYCFFNMLHTCMIEMLIKCLSTRNGDRALDLLERFQEVHINYNEKLKLGLFNSNDLKMIQEEKLKGGDSGYINQNLDILTSIGEEAKKMPILGESIFLRYLPIPFIKFLYEKGKSKFLEIYKMQNYESPILIWNADLRTLLESEIKKHTGEFVVQLKDFAKKSNDEIKDSINFPYYPKPFMNIVRYP